VPQRRRNDGSAPAAEPAVLRIVIILELARGVAHHLGGEHGQVGGFATGVALQALMEIRGGVEDVAMPRFPKLADVLEDLREAGPTVAAIGRKVGPAVKRFQFRRKKNVERPAALSAHGLDERHINLVHVRALFAVHLDADEVFVQEFRRLFVFKRLALHDVAPMAGRVADAQENGLVLLARFGERRLTPGKPIHGIVRVLEQIRGFLAGQMIRVGVSAGWSHVGLDWVGFF